MITLEQLRPLPDPGATVYVYGRVLDAVWDPAYQVLALVLNDEDNPGASFAVMVLGEGMSPPFGFAHVRSLLVNGALRSVFVRV